MCVCKYVCTGECMYVLIMNYMYVCMDFYMIVCTFECGYAWEWACKYKYV